MAGLKPAHGGSIPPFLVNGAELEQMLALQMCGMGEDIRGVILHLLLSGQLILLLVWQRMLLRE